MSGAIQERELQLGSTEAHSVSESVEEYKTERPGEVAEIASDQDETQDYLAAASLEGFLTHQDEDEHIVAETKLDDLSLAKNSSEMPPVDPVTIMRSDNHNLDSQRLKEIANPPKLDAKHQRVVPLPWLQPIMPMDADSQSHREVSSFAFSPDHLDDISTLGETFAGSIAVEPEVPGGYDGRNLQDKVDAPATTKEGTDISDQADTGKSNRAVTSSNGGLPLKDTRTRRIIYILSCILAPLLIGTVVGLSLILSRVRDDGASGRSSGLAAGDDWYDFSPTPSSSPTTHPTAIEDTFTSAPVMSPTLAPFPTTGSGTAQPSQSLVVTPSPTRRQTKTPTTHPTPSPTGHPTRQPTGRPTASPTRNPTTHPTKSPTWYPTFAPTKQIGVPTNAPIKPPTASPTTYPTLSPTRSPVRTTSPPTRSPTQAPVQVPPPTTAPIPATNSPTKAPTKPPTTAPTKAPTQAPTTSPTKSPTDDSRPPYPNYRYIAWSKMSSSERTLATNLGYSQSTWNVPKSETIEQVSYQYAVRRDFANMNGALSSQTTEEVLIAIGFTEPMVWNCWVNHYRFFHWTQLGNLQWEGSDYGAQVQAAYATLGWTESTWEAGSDPASMSKSWNQLSTTEKEAASFVCFTKDIWDQNNLSQWA
eukprot:Nitzschia sp. Nitz4//scaffold21_size171442//52884//54812//NITZ4_002155-RA/size171442-processed-gene-0.10-mRNA-1//1//CDS//3329542393//2565//frame0